MKRWVPRLQQCWQVWEDWPETMWEKNGHELTALPFLACCKVGLCARVTASDASCVPSSPPLVSDTKSSPYWGIQALLLLAEPTTHINRKVPLNWPPWPEVWPVWTKTINLRITSLFHDKHEREMKRVQDSDLGVSRLPKDRSCGTIMKKEKKSSCCSHNSILCCGVAQALFFHQRLDEKVNLLKWLHRLTHTLLQKFNYKTKANDKAITALTKMHFFHKDGDSIKSVCVAIAAP